MTVVCEGSGGLMTEAWRAVVLRFKSDDFDSLGYCDPLSSPRSVNWYQNSRSLINAGGRKGRGAAIDMRPIQGE